MEGEGVDLFYFFELGITSGSPLLTKQKKKKHFIKKHNRRRMMRFRNDCVDGCRSCPKTKERWNHSR